jgi:hypothetical protein
MAEEPTGPELTAEQARALALETGVTESQIRDIVSMVGFDRASILREARVIREAKR